MHTAIVALWRCMAVMLLCAAWPALAATYSFRGDTYSWETAANAITWDRTCTAYPGDDDKATINFSGGFTFSFAGTAYSSVRVLTNGGLQFGADTGFYGSYGNTALPAGSASAYAAGCGSGATNRVMMAYWADLDPSKGGTVTWEQKGTAPNRYVVVSWNAVYQYGTSTPYTFQIILLENGDFKYQYGNSNASGSNATIGVQVSAADYTQYSYNSGYNANGTAVRWSIPSATVVRVAEYRFEEFAYTGAIGEVADSTGNGHSGIVVGAGTSTASGQVCRGLDIPANATTAIAAMDTTVDVDAGLGTTGSVSFWYRATAAWTAGTAAMLMDATTVATRPFNLMRTATGALSFVVADSAGTKLTATTAAQGFAAGTWVHVAATWRVAAGSNQTTLRVYINGTQSAVANGTTNGALDVSLGTLYVGDNRSAATPTGATANSAAGTIDELRLYNFEESVAEIAADMAVAHSCLAVHHLEIRHATGSGLTCTPSTLTVMACTDAACSTGFTGGVTGTLTATGAGMNVAWPDGASFSIPSGQSSVTERVWLTTPGSIVLGTNGVVPAPALATTCNFGSPSCTFTAADSGFNFDVPDHVSGTAQTIAITAVQKSTNSATCTPAFANVSRSVGFRCVYANPTSGTLPVRVGGNALNAANSAASACDASGRSVSLSFDGSGMASVAVQYADVGQMTLNASYAGSAGTNDAGLVMSGTDNFIAAPASFGFSAITAAPIKAGSNFSATLTALNASGNATPNFGRETAPEAATLAFVRRTPTGAGASNGVFSGSLGAFTSGVATASNLVWTEVGSGDLLATLSSGHYLGSSFNPTGTTGIAGAVGRFTPHHFDVSIVQACVSGDFTFAAQPASVTITARNGLASPGTTLNYDGSAATSPNHAKAVTLGEAIALGSGSLSGNALAASAFTAGVAQAAPLYTFTNKQTAPAALALRATDTDTISSSGYAEGSIKLRSGRLRLSNAFGAITQALSVPVVSEYWTGASWLPNAADSCTTVPAASVAVSNVRNYAGSSATATTAATDPIAITAGSGLLSLAIPSPATGGVTFDLALNLGPTAVDQACTSVHPASTGAARAWLRSSNGSCAGTADRDPAARASFGIYTPESKKTVHVREIF